MTFGRRGSSARICAGMPSASNTFFKVLGRRLLVPGRIGGIHAHERLEVTQRFLFDIRCGSRPGCLGGGGGDREGIMSTALRMRES